jgi:hypothetical protein
MGFDMRMIPHLKRAGYRYVMVDCEYVDPVDSMSWQEIRYRPHIAEYGGEQMVIVVRDRELSDAQLAGMDYGWFYHELQERTKWCDFPPLVPPRRTATTVAGSATSPRNPTSGPGFIMKRWRKFALAIPVCARPSLPIIWIASAPTGKSPCGAGPGIPMSTMAGISTSGRVPGCSATRWSE